MTNNENCRGCSYYKVGFGHPRCKNIPVKPGGVCPCVSCIVKSMCTSVCDHLAIYVDLDRYKLNKR